MKSSPLRMDSPGTIKSISSLNTNIRPPSFSLGAPSLIGKCLSALKTLEPLFNGPCLMHFMTSWGLSRLISMILLLTQIFWPPNLLMFVSAIAIPSSLIQYYWLSVAGECFWSTFIKFLASQKLEICPSKFFVPFSCLWPWLIKRINELGLSFSCSLNHEKSFVEHRVILFRIRRTNLRKRALMEFSLNHFSDSQKLKRLSSDLVSFHAR